MAQTLGILTNDPSLLRCQLHRLRARIPFPAEDALGIGFYDDPNVLLAKRPAGVGPRDLASLVEGIQSPALLAFSSRPAVYQEEAMGPFRHRRWLFAMDGEVEGFADLRHDLEASLPLFLARTLRTPSDEEHVFALFLKELHERNRLDDPLLGGPEVSQPLVAAIRALDALAAKAGATRPTSLVAMATNGRILVAVRRGRPLSYLLAEGSGVCELCSLDEGVAGDDPRIRPHRRARSVALSGDPRGGGPFIEVPDGSLVTVGRALEINVSSL